MRARASLGKVVGWAVVCVFAAAVVPPSPAARGVAMLNPRAPFLGVIPSRPSGAAGAVQPLVQSPLTYHGGPVQHSSNAYTIFWQPVGYTRPFPTGYATVVSRFFGDVAAFSYKPSDVFAVATQYTDTVNTVKTPVFYAVSAHPVIVDTRPYPFNATVNCPNYKLNDGTTSSNCLTDAQVVNELKYLITSKVLPVGLATNFFVYTPPGVATCKTRTALATGGCYDPFGQVGFCAYHSSFVMNTTSRVLWANQPYAMLPGCASGQSPQNSTADSVINTTAHEFLEMMTDPLGTAWYDSLGNEIADKCVNVFGPPLGSTTPPLYNQLINTRKYWIQEMWSNRAQACVQRNTYPQPVASFAFSPSAPVANQTVTFHSTSTNPDGLPLKFRWTFPNGTSSALANPTYQFTAAGTYTVSLVVWDAQGDQARVLKSITVS